MDHTAEAGIMKRKTALCLGIVAGLFLLGIVQAVGAQGGGYILDWWTIDGGGGTSSGRVYEVSSTAGQPDAGLLKGSGYTLDGGFWNGPLPITPAPSSGYKIFLPSIQNN